MRILPIVLGALLVAGCSPKREVGDAQVAIAMFHAAYNHGDFGTILDQVTPRMRGAANDDKMLRILRAATAKLGPFRQGKVIGSHVNFTPGRTAISIGYSSRFRDGVANENFVFIDSDGVKRLDGYQLNSDAFIPQ
jgi:hypothetical protein